MTVVDLKESYVYILFRPTGEPCYVGKGRGRRLMKHEWRSHNPHLSAIIRLAGGKVPKLKICEDMTDQDAIAAEIAWIAAIGREENGGPLVNRTDGGEGTVGRKFTEAEREYLRQKYSGAGGTFFGRHHTDEAKVLMREAQVGRKASDDARAKMVMARRGRKHSIETRAKISALQTGEKHNLFGWKHSEASKIQISLSCRGKTRSEETRKRMSEAQLKRYSLERES